jgi:hypothetical protein
VRRGWPPAPCSAGEISKLLVAPLGRAVRSTVGQAYGAADGNPLSPSTVPQGIRPPHRTR